MIRFRISPGWFPPRLRGQRYAAACTIFYTLFEPCLRLDLSGNTYRYDVKLEHSTAHSIPVTDENVEICRHAAMRPRIIR